MPTGNVTITCKQLAARPCSDRKSDPGTNRDRKARKEIRKRTARTTGEKVGKEKNMGKTYSSEKLFEELGMSLPFPVNAPQSIAAQGPACDLSYQTLEGIQEKTRIGTSEIRMASRTGTTMQREKNKGITEEMRTFSSDNFPTKNGISAGR
jgi:hypothetical protein